MLHATCYMFMLKGGLGRGLNSLIPNKLTGKFVSEAVEVFSPDEGINNEERVKLLPVEKISANPHQPREHFDYSSLEELVNSIKRHGILQPLIVSPDQREGWQLIAGERRLRAAKILELKVVPCLVRSAQELEQLELALVENLQRADLNPLEEAKAFKQLIQEFNLTQEEAGARVGKNRATIANALRLLDLPQTIQEALSQGKITASHAKVILSASDASEQLKLFKKILDFSLTVSQSAGEVKKVQVKSHQRLIVKDLELEEKEERLRQALGTKVTVAKKGRGGTVAIEFYSAEELNEIVKKIAG